MSAANTQTKEDRHAYGSPEAKSAFSLLIVCSLLTLVLWFVPFASFLTYPFRLFVTLIHETGHALAALLTFGGVKRITIDWSGNGLTWTNGGVRLFISSAGYIGATLYGAVLLLILRTRRFAKPAAIATGILLLLITIFLGGNLAVWVTGLVFGVGLLAIGLVAPEGAVHFFMSFLGVQALLNAFFDLKTLLYLSALNPGQPTDAQNMAIATNGIIPAIAWSFGWALISLGILVLTLVIYYRSLKRANPIKNS
ncbi:MAG TPA: M50 family metallopeptidase [Blastocatellia bacterium]|nr:M50 family metallopeptidase [Blastocatellia bacterium]